MAQRSFVLILILTAAPACTSSVVPPCVDSGACPGGTVCSEGECRQLCAVQSDCGQGSYCAADGLCQPSQGGPLPRLATISGNDGNDPTRVRNGVLVGGENLGSTSFELRLAGTALPLQSRNQQPTSVELFFPADIRSGSYVLVATNAAGSDQADVTLTLPDITGDSIVDRINDSGTNERINANRLSGVQAPVNNTCNPGQAIRTIDAAGEVVCEATTDPAHDHDGDYLPQVPGVSVAAAGGGARIEVHGFFGYTFSRLDLEADTTAIPACDCDDGTAAFDCDAASFEARRSRGAECRDVNGTAANIYALNATPPQTPVVIADNLGLHFVPYGIGKTRPLTLKVRRLKPAFSSTAAWANTGISDDSRCLIGGDWENNCEYGVVMSVVPVRIYECTSTVSATGRTSGTSSEYNYRFEYSQSQSGTACDDAAYTFEAWYWGVAGDDTLEQ